MSAHRRWTQSDILELRSRLRSSDGLSGVAGALGRTPDDVSAMMRRLRLQFAAEPSPSH